MRFAVRYLPDDIKGKVLEPFGEVTDGVFRDEQRIGLVQEFFGSLTYGWLILNERAHRERAIDASPEFGVILFVGSGEEGRERIAFVEGLLDRVKIRLI